MDCSLCLKYRTDDEILSFLALSYYLHLVTRGEGGGVSPVLPLTHNGLIQF